MTDSNGPDPGGDPLRRPVPLTVTAGLFVAWLLHDLEELATLPGWAGRHREQLRRTLPGVPASTWDRLDVSRRHTTAAIGLMGVLVAAASADGVWTGGRSTVYQAFLDGFGWHALSHLAQSAVTRTYTPGVLTSPVIVAPFAIWARGRLRRAGVPVAAPGRSLRALMLLPPMLAIVHQGATAMERARSATRDR